jgi:hypothetical protein
MRRAAGLAACLAVAFLVGGVAQAWLWRLDIEVLTAAVNTQFAWAVVLFASGWVCGGQRVRDGAGAGILTGAVLIGSYYLCQALADGSGSAVSQFTKSRGPAWVIASILVGGALGVLGACAAQTRDRPVRGSFATLTMSLFLIAGPLGLVALYGDRLVGVAAVVVPVVYASAGVALASFGVRRAAPRAVLQGAGAALVATAAGVAVLVVLMQHVLYLTF